MPNSSAELIERNGRVRGVRPGKLPPGVCCACGRWKYDDAAPLLARESYGGRPPAPGTPPYEDLGVLVNSSTSTSCRVTIISSSLSLHTSSSSASLGATELRVVAVVFVLGLRLRSSSSPLLYAFGVLFAVVLRVRRMVEGKPRDDTAV